MRSLSSSPLTGSDAVSSRFAARYRRYAAASNSATVATASLVTGSDSIIRSALRRACRLGTNGCGCRDDQRRGIPSWLPAEPTPTTVSALRPARCLVYWSISCSGNRYSRRFENVQSSVAGSQMRSNQPVIGRGSCCRAGRAVDNGRLRRANTSCVNAFSDEDPQFHCTAYRRRTRCDLERHLSLAAETRQIRDSR